MEDWDCCANTAIYWSLREMSRGASEDSFLRGTGALQALIYAIEAQKCADAL